MTKKNHPLNHIRLVYQRSSPLLKCVVLTAIVVCTFCLLFLRSEILKTQAETDSARHQAADLEQENNKLKKHISELGTVQGVKYIAQTELGLVDPDDIFYINVEP